MADTPLSLPMNLVVTRTDARCKQRLVLKGWAECGCHLVRISLSQAAQREYTTKTGKAWVDETICVNPIGCGARNMLRLSGILELLK